VLVLLSLLLLLLLSAGFLGAGVVGSESSPAEISTLSPLEGHKVISQSLSPGVHLSGLFTVIV
jgi:hypothetical protein